MGESVHGPNEARQFTVTDEIATRRGAVTGIAVSPDGRVLTVAHHGDASISLIDTATGVARLTVIDVDEPLAVAMSGRRAYVSSVSDAYDEVLAFDTDSEAIVASYPVAFGVTDLSVSGDGRFAFVGRTGADGAEVVIADTATGNKTSVTIPAATVGRVRVSRDSRRLYVAANDAMTAQLFVVDIQRARIVDAVEIGSPIRDIAVSPDGAIAYVVSCGPDFGVVLDVVDTRNAAINATYKIGDAACTFAQLTLSRDGERAYLVGDEHVTVLSTATKDVLGTIVVGDAPSCAVESPDGERLYVADYAGTVTVLDIAAAAVPAGAQRRDDELSAPGAWGYSGLLLDQPLAGTSH